MKKSTLFVFACACALTFTGCKNEKTEKTDSPDTDTLVTIQVADSTIWGHLGEDTGMSTLQFITDQGDTLEVYRTNPYTGEDGALLGEIRNYTDRFAMTLTAGGETLGKAINTTQLTRTWKSESGRVDIKADGSITSADHTYNGWKVWNGHLLLSSQQKQEIGTVQRIDTLDIIHLSADSLIILNPLTKHFFRLYNPI